VVVVLARRLVMMVFAPREEVFNERTLFIVRRGLCIRKGRMLFNGDVWGEDMILSNPCLREQVRVLSVGYLEVVMLQYLDLDEALQDFPEDRQRLRTAQIKIALRHGVIKIARVLSDLEFAKGECLELTEQQWNLFFKQVLDGTFTGEIESPEEEDLVEQEIEHILEAAEEELAGACLALPGLQKRARGRQVWSRRNSMEDSVDGSEGLPDDITVIPEVNGHQNQRPQSFEDAELGGAKSSSELSLLREAICELQLKVDCLLLRDHPRHHHGSHSMHKDGSNNHHNHPHHNATPTGEQPRAAGFSANSFSSSSDRTPNMQGHSFMSRRVRSIESSHPFAASVQLERHSFQRPAETDDSEW